MKYADIPTIFAAAQQRAMLESRLATVSGITTLDQLGVAIGGTGAEATVLAQLQTVAAGALSAAISTLDAQLVAAGVDMGV